MARLPSRTARPWPGSATSCDVDPSEHAHRHLIRKHACNAQAATRTRALPHVLVGVRHEPTRSVQRAARVYAVAQALMHLGRRGRRVPQLLPVALLAAAARAQAGAAHQPLTAPADARQTRQWRPHRGTKSGRAAAHLHPAAERAAAAQRHVHALEERAQLLLLGAHLGAAAARTSLLRVQPASRRGRAGGRAAPRQSRGRRPSAGARAPARRRGAGAARSASAASPCAECIFMRAAPRALPSRVTPASWT